ncbi:MAG: metallophosphatase family protein [Treponema sp.]|jgi:putative phosphoesterase|nr:metallophosphatase family protein [Treponema sp.]
MKAPTMLVVSDSHSNYSSLAAILHWVKCRDIGAFVFLGDGISDLAYASDLAGFYPTWNMVHGNGDWQSDVPLSTTLEFAGHRFFLCHGHINRVKESLSSLIVHAQAAGAEVALYGHTHMAFWDEINGILALNPGSAGRPRPNAPASFATISCPTDEWFDIHYWAIELGGFAPFLRGRSFRRISSWDLPGSY